MKPVRLLLLGAAAVALLAIIAAAVAFNAGFQTWAARRVLASQPALHATLGSVSAGLNHVELRNVRAESHGAVLTLPTLDADLSLISAGLSKKILVQRFVAKGWTLDLSKAVKLSRVPGRTEWQATPSRLVHTEFSLLPSAFAADATAAATQVFQGVFAQLQLPVDLALDGVVLEGEVILPGARGHVRLTVTGGGLAAGREGKFDLVASAALTATAVSTVESRVTLAATMDTPRSFTRLVAKGGATASGVNFPRGVKLAGEFSARRAASGEDYTVTLATDDKQLVVVAASFPPTARQLGGTWKLDLRDTDVTPFTLGRALPTFAANGGGKFEFDPASLEVRVDGKLAAAAEGLAVLKPELSAVGPIKFSAEFDVTQRGEVIRAERLAVSLATTQPVAAFASLQPLEFNRTTHALKVADAARELFLVTLQGVPLAWTVPFTKNVSASGGDVRGEFVATASDGGFTLRPKAPLTIAGLAVARDGQPLARNVDLSLNASVDYTPQGWQASVAPLLARSGNATLLTLDARAGQLTGRDEPIKTTGKFSADLAALLAQPAAAGAFQLQRGAASGEFAASLGATKEVQAKLALTNLVADPKLTTEKLPTLSLDLRADLAAGGMVSLNAPLLVERDGRASDLTIVGTLTPGAEGLTVAARVTSTKLVLDDVKILAAPFAATSAESTAPTSPTAKPAAKVAPWAGVNGQVALNLKEVIVSDSFHATDVGGVVRVDASTLKFDQFRAGLGSGETKLSGAVSFDAKSATPFSLSTDLAVSEFDPAPLFRALDSTKPATVEGKFNVTSKLSGRAATLGDLATAAHGDFQLTSKGGVFRGLPVTAQSKVEAASKAAAAVGFLGNLAGAVTGRKEYSDLGNRAQALAEVTKIWQAVAYDQLSVVVTRDAALNTVLKDFTLISPELRLTGGGRATHVAGRPLLEEAIAMEFKLRARGHHGDLLKYLGVLDGAADELGYAVCTLPLKVAGTLGSPDTSELNRALTSLALEKSGASDLLNKLLGGK